MYSFVQSLFAACVAGLVVWYLMRRGSSAGGNTASTTAEIERLRAVVEELTAALEQKAGAAEQRLGKMIGEAQAVQGLLDRTLAKVGAQIVRTETAEAASPVSPESTTSSSIQPVKPRPEMPAPRPDTSTEPAPAGDGGSRPAIRSMSEHANVADVLSASAATPPARPADPASSGNVAEPEPASGHDSGNEPAAAETIIDGSLQSPIAAPPASELVADTTSLAPEPETNVAPVMPATPAVPKSPTLPGSREPKETAEREARVMSLVARGITNSVEIARQTGLTRGEVELILTLHNLHIAPGREGFAPEYSIPGTPELSPAEPDAGQNAPASADQIPVNPDDRYAAIYALIAAGVTDSVEIARRTGLGRGEVELHMGLHARKVL